MDAPARSERYAARARESGRSLGIVDMSKPYPVADELTRPFWEAAARGELVIQHCGACRRFQHPPQPMCQDCLGADLEYRSVSGRGRVWSHATTHQQYVNGFELPQTNVIVELDDQEGLLMASEWPAEAAPPAIGAAVAVSFESRDTGPGETVAIPQFRPLVGGAR
jgi:uncharacterized OB-fold protein